MGKWSWSGGCGPNGWGAIPEAIIAMKMAGRGWGGDWGSEWEGGRGRRGRRRMFEAGELRLVLLKLIVDQPRHGYDLIRAIEEMTGGDYAPSPGVVYPTLTMLEDMGLIEEERAEGSRKLYAATDAGRAHLEERSEEVASLMARLEKVGAKRARGEGIPIGRAMGNLARVLAHRLSSEDVDRDLLHEVAGIIDEAAQKIERL
jgi:DNA-binding PadR family transcriptional regulator